jgi:hypothetical protein
VGAAYAINSAVLALPSGPAEQTVRATHAITGAVLAFLSVLSALGVFDLGDKLK